MTEANREGPSLPKAKTVHLSRDHVLWPLKPIIFPKPFFQQYFNGDLISVAPIRPRTGVAAHILKTKMLQRPRTLRNSRC